MGFPIRKSTDQRVFAPPRSLSQRITSFIACACQGIHQLPLRHLIVLIANAHPKIALQTVLAQKDQLLEIGPGARLGKPIICGRLSVSPRQTRAFNARSAERSKPIGDRTQASDTLPNGEFSQKLEADKRITTWKSWWSRSDSNRRHPACKAGALPAELRPLIPFVEEIDNPCGLRSGGPGRT